MHWASAGLTKLHRVLGVGIGLLVMLWFGSGAVLLFVPYPSLTEVERFRWLAPLQLDECCVSLDSVWRQVGLRPGVERVRLLMAAGRPVYVVHFLDGTLASLWADDGEPVSKITRSEALRIARPGILLEGVGTAEALQDDQWTVQQHVDPHRPLWKVPLDDADEREIYVSSATGEVVMDTTVFERRWNTVGAVIHWLYVPILRRHWAVWDQTVWWLAAIGGITAATGLALGIQHHRGTGHGHRSPFVGMKRWHHLGGLVIGALLCTWLLSGLLSMDHGRWFSMPEPTGDQRLRFMGGALMPQDVAVPLREALRQVYLGEAVKEIMLTKVGGATYYVFRSDPEQQVVMSALTAQAPAPKLALDTLAQAAKTVIPAQQIDRSEIIGGDRYYYSTAHHPRPPSALRIVLDDPAQTWVHIDTKTGQLLELMDHSRRVYRWLFHGLHSWDIPLFLEHDRQRRLVLMAFCIAGFLFSLSGVCLGITVLVSRAPRNPSAIR